MNNFKKDTENYLRERIEKNGPMDMGEFMALALGHPEWGYYMCRDPLGAAGDFTTAPEISQMFGELIGAWLVDTWTRLGSPDPFLLIECGPGRGTLMEDALHATRKVEGFHKARELLLMETSPVLRDKQKGKLGQYDPQWLDSIDAPLLQNSDVPILLIANEFLDALPVRQLQMTSSGWREQVINVNDKGFIFTTAVIPAKAGILKTKAVNKISASAGMKGLKEDDIFEISPAREAFVRKLCGLIRQNGGASLFIDYGHARSAVGDTLQAVKNHEYVPVLSHIGEADLTAHVDFEALSHVAREAGVFSAGPIGQGIFLHNLGIAQRAEALGRNASAIQKEEIASACTRLCDPAQMGELFKVMAFCHDQNTELAGF